MLKELEVLESEFNSVRQQINEKFRTLFKSAIEEVFSKSPALNIITWTQYTLYFNDGEPCEFSVGSPTFTNAPNTEDIRWGEYNGEDPSIFCLDSWSDDTREGVDLECCKKFSDLITSDAFEDFMHNLFGNDTKVTAVRGQDIVVEHYDHD